MFLILGGKSQMMKDKTAKQTRKKHNINTTSDFLCFLYYILLMDILAANQWECY